MDNTTLKRIFEFLEEKGEHRIPLKFKLLNNETLTEEDLKVKGDLKLNGTQLTSLPEGLTVGGDLLLYYSKITSLPEGLYVGGSLDLEETKITSLPKGLKVGGSLFIRETALLEYSDEELRDMIKHGFIKGTIYR